MHHVGVGGHRRDRDDLAIFQFDGANMLALGHQPGHLRIQLQLAAQILIELHQPLHQRPGATAGKPDAPLTLQGVDQGIDGRGGKRITAHQQ